MPGSWTGCAHLADKMGGNGRCVGKFLSRFGNGCGTYEKASIKPWDKETKEGSDDMGFLIALIVIALIIAFLFLSTLFIVPQ